MIQGTEYAFEDIEVVLLGRPLTGITGIKYKVTKTKKNLMGRGGVPVSRYRGQKNFEGEMTVYLSELLALMDSTKLDDITDIPPFDIILTFGQAGSRIITHTLQDCEFTEFEIDMKQDSETVVGLPLIVGSLNKGRKTT